MKFSLRGHVKRFVIYSFGDAAARATGLVFPRRNLRYYYILSCAAVHCYYSGSTSTVVQICTCTVLAQLYGVSVVVWSEPSHTSVQTESVMFWSACGRSSVFGAPFRRVRSFLLALHSRLVVFVYNLAIFPVCSYSFSCLRFSLGLSVVGAATCWWHRLLLVLVYDLRRVRAPLNAGCLVLRSSFLFG